MPTKKPQRLLKGKFYFNCSIYIIKGMTLCFTLLSCLEFYGLKIKISTYKKLESYEILLIINKAFVVMCADHNYSLI